MKLSGIYPPIVTPFENEEVAYNRLSENLTKWNKTPLSGYLILGSNGENVLLTEDEKLSILEIARNHIPKDKLMIAGTGCESTIDTIRLTNIAATTGSDFALIITPSFFKSSMKPENLLNHYTAVANESRIPILIYNVPQFTGINIPIDVTVRLSEHPNIVGIKDSLGDVYQLSEIICMTGEDFSVLVGSAPVLFPSLCIGASGGILALANIAPNECVDIFNLYISGEIIKAKEMQLRMTPVAVAVTTKYGIGGLKSAMDMLGYFGGKPRSPLLPPKAEEIEDIKSILSEAGLLKETC